MDLLEISLDEIDRQHLILAYSYQGDIEELVLTLEEQTQQEEDEATFLKRVPIVNRSRTRSGLTALMIACVQGFDHIVEEVLLHWSADPNLKVTVTGAYQGMTALHFAVRNNETQCVELLLNARCNVNPVDSIGNTPLIIASKHNCDETVPLLLKCRGIDVDKQDKDGKSALMWACQLGHQSIVKRLLDSDANMTLVDKEGRNCIMYASEYGHYRILQVIALFIDDYKLYNQADKLGLTALHLAALNGHRDTLKYLFEVKNINIHALDNDKRTILHAAMYSGSEHAVEVILAKESQYMNKPKLVNAEDVNKRTPLFYISLKGKIPSLPGADPLVKDRSGLTPLHWMCIRGNIRCLQYFKDIDPEKFKDSNGNSLLHAAAQYGHYKCCHFLINVLKSDVNANNKNKETALHKAAAGNYHEVVHLLLSKGAQLNVTDYKGRSPLHKAAMHSATHSLTQLLERGAKVNLQDIYRRTALHYACIKGNASIIEVLLREDINLSLLDNRKRSALHLACLYNKEECVQLLLNSGFDVNGVDMYYATPIMYASYKGDISVVKLLESVNANLNLLDNSGRNCIHYACMGGHLEVCEYIHDLMTSQYQISINITDKLNRTPLFYACSKDKDSIVEYLLEQGATINSSDSLSQHPIYQASQNYDILNLLIERGANLNLRDNKGNTLLHLICKNSEKKFRTAVEQVLEKLPDLLNTSNVDGIQPIHISCLSGNYSVLSDLIDKGANINAVDNIGRTPSHYAALKGSKDCLLELATSDCDMNIKDRDCRLPLHLAVIRGNLECCSYLSARNTADLGCTDSYGRTPFFYACKGKTNIHAEIADSLMDDSDISIQDKKLLSPLHYAVLNYHKSLLKRMFYNEVNINVKDSMGVTPLMIAAAKGYFSLVKMFVKRGADCNLLDYKGRNAYLFAKIHKKDSCRSYLEQKTTIKEETAVSTTEDLEILHRPTRISASVAIPQATANEILNSTEMTSNYPPSPYEETMEVASSDSTEFNFATETTPFGVPYEQRQELLNGAQRLQQTSEILDSIERRQAEFPKRLDSLSELLAKNSQLESEIQQLSQQVADSNYQHESQKLSSLLRSRKPKTTQTDQLIKLTTTKTHVYKNKSHSEAYLYHIIMIVLLSLTIVVEISMLYH